MFSDYYHMGGAHVLEWIFWLLIVGLIAFGLLRQANTRREAGESPKDLLQRRLAAGEITPEEYEQRLALLNRDS